MAGMESAVRSIIASVKPLGVSKENIAKGLTKMYTLPGTGMQIAAPASLTALMARPEGNRPALWNYWYTLNLTDGFMISIHDNAYSDKKQPNLKADLDYLVGTMKDGFKKLGTPEDQAGSQDGWTTFIRVLPYSEKSVSYTMVWHYWASPGRTIFLAVKVSDALGGKARALELAKSLRPVKAG